MNTDKLYSRRSYIWNNMTNVQCGILFGVCIIGSIIGSLSVLFWGRHNMLAGLILFAGIGIIIWSFRVMFIDRFWFKPEPGCILYDNLSDAKDRNFDKYRNHYGYDEDKIYCVLKCDHDKIFYYKKKDEKIHMHDLDTFFLGDNNLFIQIGYDEEVAKRGNELNYFELAKIIRQHK